MYTYIYIMLYHMRDAFIWSIGDLYCGVPQFVKNIIIRL